jgi:hypothetical protein
MREMNKSFVFKNKYLNDINFPFKIMMGYIVFIGILFIFTITRNLNKADPFSARGIDIVFINYVCTVILGSIALYKLIKLYFEFHSLEYLLICFFIFGTMITLFIWQILFEFLFAVPINGSSEFIDAVTPELGFYRNSFYFGVLLFLIYAIRLRSWNNYSFFMKIVIVIALLSNLSYVVFDLISWILLSLKIYPFSFHVSNIWPYLTIDLIIDQIYQILIPNGGRIYIGSDFSGPIMIAYYFFVYNVFRSKQLGKSRSRKVSKYYWLLIIGSNIVFIYLGAFFDQTKTLFHNFLSFSQLIFLVGLLIILFFSPELILITDLRLFKAKNLYKIIKKAEISDETSFLDQSSNYKLRLKNYIESIPPETLDFLELGQ